MTETTPLNPRLWSPGSSWLWKTGALFVSAGILAGAFGAHALRRRPTISPESVHTWERASSYAVWNGLGLLLVSLHPRFSRHKFAGPAIATGGFMFTGSIMALVLAKEQAKFLGPITPFGGIIMVAGYISLAL